MFLNWPQRELTDALLCNGKSLAQLFFMARPHSTPPCLGEFVKNGQPFRTSLKTVIDVVSIKINLQSACGQCTYPFCQDQ